MTITVTDRDDVKIAHTASGPTDGQPLLLIMGAGGSMRAWHPGFVRALEERCFRVIRFDNRDSGRSTRFTDRGAPKQLTMLLQPAKAASYSLDDMADDAVAVLDAQGHRTAHVVGLSLGGMIAQILAVRHPDRVRTLTSISSTPSTKIGKLPMRTGLRIAKIAKKPITTQDEFVAFQLAMAKIAGSPAYPTDVEWLASSSAAAFADGFDMAATQRQTAAAAAAGDRRPQLSRLRLPTLVVHGADDPVALPAGGVATAETIPNARLVIYPGMGHDLPRELWPSVIGELVTLTHTTDVAGPAHM
jgi:pimeloyl-ACP methyl ester carboxylesterase